MNMKAKLALVAALGSQVRADVPAIFRAEGGRTSMEDIKKLIEDGNRAFEEHKHYVDRRMREIEANGQPSAETETALKRIGDDLDKVNDRLKELYADNDRLDEIEARINRMGLGGGGGDPAEELKQARAFWSSVYGRPVEDTEIDLEQIRAYRKAFTAYLRRGDKAISGDIRAALEVGSDPDGGYYVDPDTTGRIVQLIHETSPVRQVANVVTIGTDALEGVNDLDEAGSGWVGETASRTETTTPTVGEYRIPVHEQYAEPRATQKILDDAMIDIAAWLGGKIADKLAREENKAFVKGSGVGKPRGFLDHTTSTSAPSSSSWSTIQHVVSGASGAFATSDPGDPLIDLVFKLKAAYRASARWSMNRATLGEVRKLKDGQGNYLWTPDFGQMANGQLVGFPITEMEDMPDIAADSLSIAFADWNQAYQIVDRQGIRTLRDPYTTKPYVKFYTTKRVGGDVVNFEAIKLFKFSA